VKALVAGLPPVAADGDSESIVEAWSALPGPIKVGVLALVNAAAGVENE
jgi:hypothetical protein